VLTPLVGLLAAQGLASGALAAFLSSASVVDVPGLRVVSWGALLALAAHPLLVWQAARWVGRTVAGVTVAVAWYAAVLVLLLPRPTGAVVVLSDTRGLTFLVCGLLLGPLLALYGPGRRARGGTPGCR
jgi:hypothetical protein